MSSSLFLLSILMYNGPVLRKLVNFGMCGFADQCTSGRSVNVKAPGADVGVETPEENFHRIVGLLFPEMFEESDRGVAVRSTRLYLCTGEESEVTLEDIFLNQLVYTETDKSQLLLPDGLRDSTLSIRYLTHLRLTVPSDSWFCENVLTSRKTLLQFYARIAPRPILDIQSRIAIADFMLKAPAAQGVLLSTFAELLGPLFESVFPLSRVQFMLDCRTSPLMKQYAVIEWDWRELVDDILSVVDAYIEFASRDVYLAGGEFGSVESEINRYMPSELLLAFYEQVLPQLTESRPASGKGRNDFVYAYNSPLPGLFRTLVHDQVDATLRTPIAWNALTQPEVDDLRSALAGNAVDSTGRVALVCICGMLIGTEFACQTGISNVPDFCIIPSIVHAMKILDTNNTRTLLKVMHRFDLGKLLSRLTHWAWGSTTREPWRKLRCRLCFGAFWKRRSIGTPVWSTSGTGGGGKKIFVKRFFFEKGENIRW